MDLIEVTFAVLKLLIFRLVKVVHFQNILYIVVTLDVSQFPIFRVVIPEPVRAILSAENRLSILVT